MTDKEELRRKLTDAGLGKVAERILQFSRPCYHVRRAIVQEEDLAIGASKFGGSPDVPADFVWPQVHNDKRPEALEFVAQIRLSDLPEPMPEPLPRDGLLSFFTRWDESRVFYYPRGTALERTEGPYAPVAPAPVGFWQTLRAELTRKPNPHNTYRAASLKFEPALSLPDGNSAMIRDLNLSEEDDEAYLELCETLWPESEPGTVLKHQMLGYSSPVQNEMELECDSLRRGEKMKWDVPNENFIAAARDWVLLLQVDSDDGQSGPGWMWGDLGIVYFWIHRDDLAGRAFEKVNGVEQCH
jgi:uncharacterized protein YwqG